MSGNSSFKFSCPHCAGRIEAPPGYAGLSIPCPHCGQTILAAPPAAAAETGDSGGVHSRPPERKIARWMVGGIAAAGLLAAMFAFWSSHQPPRPASSRSTPEAPSFSSPRISTIISTNTDRAAPLPAPRASIRPKSIEDLQISPIRLERQPNSALVYATGSVTNNSEAQRFGVRVELELLNQAKRKVGSSSDYTQVIEPRKTWVFRALVTDPKAASARLARITEEP